ncbi:hypothetical protein FB192DRAFT_1368810 [Mucor lusitanicus]|uniref:Uncharacterized protein n=1 Tax=Mucor circinelloides f. lusitanicus TaxID=29924 RepID=A0A8H4BLD5_MUCCL|nr:hypothetical protein FB192DRAFT_1368810 [Mucor lusitanicus]
MQVDKLGLVFVVCLLFYCHLLSLSLAPFVARNTWSTYARFCKTKRESRVIQTKQPSQYRNAYLLFVCVECWYHSIVYNAGK